MGLRVDVIADTGWAAEGLAAALQRGAQTIFNATNLPEAVSARPVSLERWLTEAPESLDHTPEVVVVLLADASFAAHVLQRLPASTPVLWLHSSSEGIPSDPEPERPIGRLPPDAADMQLFAAVNALAHGLSVSMPIAFYPQPSVVPPAPAEELAEPLTARELEVLELMAKGLANREIADALGISSHTAKFHVAQILDKTGSATRTEVVRQGLRLGLIGL